MKRATRNAIATVIFALIVACFGVFFWMFMSDFASSSVTPNATLGLTYPLNNHGSYVYVTAVQTTGLALLFWTAFLGFWLALAIVPKTFRPLQPGQARWPMYFGARAETDLGQPTRRLKLIFVVSLAFWLAAIWLFGGAIATFAVSRGFVLGM